MSSDEPPRPVLLTDELRAQLNSVSTATLTNQLQRKGIRSTFLTGLKPIKPGQRMLGLRPHLALRADTRRPQRAVHLGA